MKTNSDEGGVERITVAALRPEIDIKPRHRIHVTDLATKDLQLDPLLLAPHSLMIVKGWTRMLALYTVLAALYEKAEFMEACRGGAES